MMTSLVSSVIEFLTAHPHVAYLAVFLLALSESIRIIGVVVPGTPSHRRAPTSVHGDSRREEASFEHINLWAAAT